MRRRRQRHQLSRCPARSPENGQQECCSDGTTRMEGGKRGGKKSVWERKVTVTEKEGGGEGKKEM